MEGKLAAIGAVADDGVDTIYREILWTKVGILG